MPVFLVVAAIVVGAVAILGYFKRFRVPENARYRAGVDINNQTVLLPGPERIRRSGFSPDKFVTNMQRGETLYEAFLQGVKVAGELPFLGTRQGEGPYEWQTYNQVQERIVNFASGLIDLDVKPGQASFVGVYSINRPEWFITEQACNSQSMVLVPLYDTLGADAVKFIVKQAGMCAISLDTSKLDKVLRMLPEMPSLKLLIAMGPTSESDKNKAQEAGAKLVSFSEVEARGKSFRKPPRPPRPEDLATVCYTSGTTGDPKGVMLTHANLIADASGAASILHHSSIGYPALSPNDTHISYLPLAHMFERTVQVWLYSFGARIAYSRGDVKLLMSDIAAARPTIFCSVPRLLNRIYDRVTAGVAGSNIKKLLFDLAMTAKEAELKQGIIRNNSVWDLLVFGKIQSLLGGRVRFVVTGAAPISAKCLTFLRCAFGCPVVEGYGQTECTAGGTMTVLGDNTPGSVGMILPCGEIRLDSVPDMKYFAEKDQGEVCFRGPHVMKGYLNAPDKTAEAIDKDGWLHSGDIGMFLPNGTLRIIDRKKAIFKLAQGEYVAPEKLENVYTRAGSVAQCFVYGNSLESTLVAIVVPDFESLPKWIATNCPGVSASDPPAQLCASAALEKAIFDEMIATGKAQNLQGFELIKKIKLVSDPFTVENGLLTPTFKSKRPQLQAAFQKEIDAMYATIHALENATKGQN